MRVFIQKAGSIWQFGAIICIFAQSCMQVSFMEFGHKKTPWGKGGQTMGEQKEVEIIASHGFRNTRYPKKVQ